MADRKRLKALKDESGKLKKLLADAMLGNSALKTILARKVIGPAVKRETVASVKQEFMLSERRPAP